MGKVKMMELNGKVKRKWNNIYGMKGERKRKRERDLGFESKSERSCLFFWQNPAKGIIPPALVASAVKILYFY